MTRMHDSALGVLTGGGQQVLHFLRMLGQVLRKFGGAVLVLVIVAGVALYLKQSDPYERGLAVRYAVSQLQTSLFPRADRPTVLMRRDGSLIETTVGQLAESPVLAEVTSTQLRQLVASLITSLVLGAVLLSLLGLFIWRTGRATRRDRHLRGARVVEQAELLRLMRAHHMVGTLRIADVPLVRGVETSHLLVTGSPGSGKTQALLRLLSTLRQRGDRVVCFSPSGDFIQAFYRAERDVLLNPFDARCPHWNLWDDCAHDYDHDLLASAMIPDPATVPDPFWQTAARTVLASLTLEMGRRGERSTPMLLDRLALAPLADLHQYLSRTPAAALLSPDSEKPALSIRTTAVTYARALAHLPKDGTPFSLRRWVADEQGGGWIFLNATAPQLAAARPLLSMWLELLTNALLGLPEHPTRRIWLVIDELPALHKVPSLEEFLARARKHGGCAVVAFQSIAQLRERYGRDGAEAIAGLCRTWVTLSQSHPETARWIASSFGQAEVIEASQGLSYGANEIRDGVSISNQRKLVPALIDAEITALAPMNGFIRMPGALPDGSTLPAARFSFDVVPPPHRSAAFIEREVPVADAADVVTTDHDEEAPAFDLTAPPAALSGVVTP